jgi:hypothetical protein
LAELKNEIRIEKTSSRDIKMEFSLEICARVSLESHKIHRKQHTGNTMVKAYKHLCVEESHNIEHKNEKKVQRIGKKNKIDLENRPNHKKSKILATGKLTVPLLKYKFVIINWHQE